MAQPDRAAASIPVLLRHARTTYASAMRTALHAAGFDDLPGNGLYVIGGLARESAAHPLGRLIDDLRLSKQAAGQLVDALVTRGYLHRETDRDDRRRLTVRLTERGRAAARVLADARATVDAALRSRIGSDDFARLQRSLAALVDLASDPLASAPPAGPASATRLFDVRDTRGTLHAERSMLAGSRFSDVSLAQSRFDDVNLQDLRITNANLRGTRLANANLADVTIEDVNLQGLRIRNVNLRGTRLDDVNLTDVAIDDANLTGMTIHGRLVTDLLHAGGRPRPLTVLYARSVPRLRAFYVGVAGLAVEHEDSDHVVLGSARARLLIHAIPAAIAAELTATDPSERRSDAALKMSLEVADLAVARQTAPTLGGALDPVEREWLYEGERVCDGVDPEGNVVQFRARGPAAPTSAVAAEAVIGLYERHAELYVTDRARVGWDERVWLDRFLALLPDQGSVLDLGCGCGDPVARYLTTRGVEVVGVDASPTLIAHCRAGLPNQTWHVADMRGLALDRSFDGILAWDSFFHLCADDQRRMFAVFDRHAAPGAALMFTSGTARGESVGTYRGEPLYHASLDPAEYRTLLEAYGFRVEAHVVEDPTCGNHTVWLARRAPHERNRS